MKKTIKKSIALGMAISMLGSVSAIAGTTASVAKNITVYGDKIICIAPYFGEYNSYISNANGVRVVVSPDTETFSINFSLYCRWYRQRYCNFRWNRRKLYWRIYWNYYSNRR